MNYNLEYTFYYQYNSSELFNNIFNKRKQNILLNNNSQYKKCDNELKLVLGHNTRKSYKLGQEINVIVKKADIYKRQIDLTLVN